MAATDNIRLRFDHVSIAVKSIDRAYDFFAKYFPIKLRGAKSLDDQVSGSFYWQDFHLGGFVVELIEDPPGKPGFVTKFIERHGEGMHHLSIETDNLDAMVANLKAGGVRVVDEQKYESGSATAFISPRSAFGALIQFWHTPNWEQALLALSRVGAGSTVKMDIDESGIRRTIEIPLKDVSDPSRVLGYAPIRPIIDQVAPGTPADRAGLREGDAITAVNGNKIEYWEQFRQATQLSNGQPMTLDLTRQGQPVHLMVTPKRGAADTDEKVYQIGVLPRDETAYKHVSFSDSVRLSGAKTVESIGQTVDVVGKLFSGRVSIKQLQGPVGISHLAGQAVRRGPLDVISLMVVISINLGILNLLPIPILDGGNILLLAIEGIMRRDLSLSFKERFVQVGLVFLLVIFAIVMYNDILRRITSHS